MPANSGRSFSARWLVGNAGIEGSARSFPSLESAVDHARTQPRKRGRWWLIEREDDSRNVISERIVNDAGELMRHDLPIIAHSDTGDLDCCGRIFPVFRENEADITCNECGSIIKTVPADQAVDALMEMALSQESSIATCPHWGQENVFPGFSEMFAFICEHCEKGSSSSAIKPDPNDFPDFEDESGNHIRPLPHLPRCRGIAIGDGNYTGCAYGYDDVPPFTGPCDCPTCNGSGLEGEGSFQPN